MDRTKTLLRATYVIIRKYIEDWPVIDPEEILLKNQYGLTDWVVYDPIQKNALFRRACKCTDPFIRRKER